MKLRNIFLPLIAFAVPAWLSAQDLHKEITVEQEIVPAKRDASRIMVHPAVKLPPLKSSQLSFSDRTVTTGVPNSITILDPVAWGDRLYSSPWRGYVDLGLGTPTYNGLVSAGYRLLDDDRTRLSVWGQYNGDVYKRGHGFTEDHLKWKNHTATLGLDLHRAVGSRSFIDAGVDYTYATHTLAAYTDTYTQGANRFNAGVMFHSEASGLAYEAGLKYRRFSFGKPERMEFNRWWVVFDPDKLLMPHINENFFDFDAKGHIATSEHSRAGLEVDVSFLRTSDHIAMLIPLGLYDFERVSAKTTGLVTLTPFWSTHSDKLTLRVGADVDFAIKSGNAIRVSPDVTFGWTPTQIFGLELKAHGGSHLNTLSELYDITPYINGYTAYTGMSRIPYAFDGRITLGPFLGSFVEVFGGYAKADRWLMGASANMPGGFMHGTDIKGWHFGVAAGYDNGRTFSLRASWETAPSEYDKAYYEWRDRARHVVKAELKVRPISRLTVQLGYEFRSGRCEYAYDYTPVEILGLPYYEPIRVGLRAISDLSVGAGYEVSDRVTFFAKGSNLMNREWRHLGNVRVQGAHGLVGVEVKF